MRGYLSRSAGELNVGQRPARVQAIDQQIITGVV
jgi:hypothetical protein